MELRQHACLNPAVIAHVICALLLAVSLCGCGDSGVLAQGPVPALAPNADAAAPAIGAALPAVGALPRQASFSTDQYHYGRAFYRTLPSNLVTADGNSAVFAPTGGESLPAAAFAIFGFELWSPDDVVPEVELGWAADATPAGDCWLGLANWESGRWDWFTLDGKARLALPEIGPYLDDSIALLRGIGFAVVLVTGDAPARLDWLRMGANLPPEGHISAEPAGPLRSLHFTLTAKDLDGAVAVVAWDFDDDGHNDAWNDYDIEYTYAQGGYFRVTALLMDNDRSVTELAEFAPVSSFGIAEQPVETDWGMGAAALDATGVAHVVFVHTPNELPGSQAPVAELRYATDAGGQWMEEAICQVSSNVGKPVLALNGSQPVVLIADDDEEQYTPSWLTRAWRAGGQWHTEQIADGASDLRQPCLVIDAVGVEHIAYMATSPALPQVRYAAGTGSFVFTDVPPPAGFDHFGYGSVALALDAAAQPHVAAPLLDEYPDGPLAYLHRDGAEWISEELPVVVGSDDELDILIDGQSAPYIAIGAYDDITLVSYDGSAWQQQTWEQVGGEALLALDAAGRPMIAVGQPNGWDWGLEGRTHFIYTSGDIWYTETLELLGYGGTLFGFGLTPEGRAWMAYDGPQLRFATRME